MRDLVVAGDLEVDEVAGHLRLEVVAGVRGDDPAPVDDHDPVAEGVGLVEVVGGQEHRRPALRAQPGDVVPEVGPRLRVQAGGRLVEEDQRRVVDQPHRDVEPALLAAGHVLGHPGPQALELELVEELLAAARGVGPRQAVEHPVVHHLVAGAGRGEGAAGLGDVADAAPHLLRLPHHVVARDGGGARGRPEQGDEHPQRGGLARAVGAEEADHLALGDVEVDPVDGLDRLLLLALPGLEGLHESSCVDHGAPLLGPAGGGPVPMFKIEHVGVKRTFPRTDRRSSADSSPPASRPGDRRLLAPPAPEVRGHVDLVGPVPQGEVERHRGARAAPRPRRPARRRRVAARSPGAGG